MILGRQMSFGRRKTGPSINAALGRAACCHPCEPARPGGMVDGILLRGEHKGRRHWDENGAHRDALSPCSFLLSFSLLILISATFWLDVAVADWTTGEHCYVLCPNRT